MLRCISPLIAFVAALSACGIPEAPLMPLAEGATSPGATISDAVHSAGTAGFYFLAPIVPNPNTTGSFDDDINALDPSVTICDLALGADVGCGGNTPAAVYTRGTDPAIAVDGGNGDYRVNWRTSDAAFEAGRTYRVHVTAGVSGARRDLGFVDVLLTSSPGQAKNIATGDIITLNDGQTLPIKFRIETSILGALSVALDPSTVFPGESSTASATALSLHGVPMSGLSVTWSSTGTPVTLAQASSMTNGSGIAMTGVLAGSTPGSASIGAAVGGLSASATLTINDINVCRPAGSSTVISTPATTSIGPIYVTNWDGHSVTAYAAGANGNASPVVTIQGPATGLSGPRGVGRDASGSLYVANYHSNSITVYASGSDGNASPARVIAGANTQINGPEGLTVDGAGRVYVANQVDHKVLVFAAGANGNVAPARIIAGTCTGLNRPMGLALDASGRLYVANLAHYNSVLTQSVTVYDPGSTGNQTPLATITGDVTRLHNPLGITVDATGYIYVANYGNTDAGPSNFATRVVVYAPGATGNVAPTRVITGSMSEPTGLAVDAAGALHVASFFSDFLTVFAAGADGPSSPIRVISGSNTRLVRPSYLTF
jgi:sugar lactone lactonase YvrE